MWTGYEIKAEDFFIDGVDYRCPFCFGVIDFDRDEYEEFYVVRGNVYHKDCLEGMVRECGAKYIKECDLTAYANWYLYADFHGDIPMWIQDEILKDTKAIHTFIIDGLDEDKFIDWYDEHENEETQKEEP